MKKPILSVFLSLALAGFTVPAYAETLVNDDGWQVVYGSDGSLSDTFSPEDIDAVFAGMQPGDTAQVTVDLHNGAGEATSWYMANTVLSSLEQSKAEAEGGAYGYRLEYLDASGETTVLFSSDIVGGDAVADGREGLTQATSSLEDYIVLGQADPGEDSQVRLTVSLDGETQGNGYQNTLADIELRFAAEGAGGSSSLSQDALSTFLVKTGDTLVSWPVALAALLSGLLLALIAFKRGIREREEVR